MPKIEPLSIKLPPNRLFQPITTDYKNNLTEVEFLLGVLKKLNEMIVQVNYDSEFIENYAGEIEKLQKEMAKVYSDNEKFKIDLQASINNQLVTFRNEVINLIETQVNGVKAYVDTQDAALREYIDSISLGNIILYNPVTGEMQPLEAVIYSIYNMSRSDALTATEYDALDLTATAYDAYDLTAAQYDSNGKSLLV